MAGNGGQLYHGLNFAAYGGKVNRFDGGGDSSFWSDINNSTKKMWEARANPDMSSEVMNNIQFTYDNYIHPKGINGYDSWGDLMKDVSVSNIVAVANNIWKNQAKTKD